MTNLYIVGAGGLGRGLAATLEKEKKSVSEDFNQMYFVDDAKYKEYVNGIFVKHNLEELLEIQEKCLVINAMGSPEMRKSIQHNLSKNTNLSFPNFIDSDVKLNAHIKMGEGNIISRGVVFSTNIEIGDFNLIHFNCTVGHDVKLKNFNCIYPLVSLSGYTDIGNNNMIGTNSSTLPRVRLKNNIIVGANTLINRDILDQKTVIGSPAREIK